LECGGLTPLSPTDLGDERRKRCQATALQNLSMSDKITIYEKPT